MILSCTMTQQNLMSVLLSSKITTRNVELYFKISSSEEFLIFFSLEAEEWAGMC